MWIIGLISYSSVQLPSHVRLFVTPWTAACQASLSITNSWSLLKLMSIELVMPSKEATTIRFWRPPPWLPEGVGVLLQGHLENRVSFALL